MAVHFIKNSSDNLILSGCYPVADKFIILNTGLLDNVLITHGEDP